MDRDVTPDNSDNRYGSAGGAGLECVTLGILVFLTAWGGIVLTQQTDRIAAIWAANAVLLSMLLGRPTRIWPSLLLSALIANIAADLVTGDELSIAVGLALCNSFEVLLVAVPMRILYAEVDLTHPRTLMLFGVLALGPAPFLSAMPAAGLLVYVKGATFWQVVRAWYPADALGLLTITPLLMTMRRTELAGLFRPARLPATLAVLAVVLAALMLMFGQSRYPLLFLGFPALLFAAFRLGPAGTTLAVAVMVAGALVATITGNGPLSTLVASMRQQVLLLQVFLAITAFTILQLAAVLAGRSRLEFALREAKEAAERSEAERRASAQRLQMTLDNMDQGLIMVDADGRISICNRRVLQLLDLPGDLIARQPHSSEVIAYQAAIGEFVGLSQETKAGLEPRVAESGFHVYERERPNGTALEIRTVSLPQGGVVRTYTDITHRRRTDKAVKESEALYRLLAENAIDMIGRTGLDGIRRYVSPASSGILGFLPAELVGTRPVDFVHPDDQAEIGVLLRRLLTGEVAAAASVHRLRHKAGHWVWVEVRFRLLQDAHTGAPLELVTTTRDVGERQKKAEELHEARDAAEMALARAEHASQAKTEFLATMSHEIRTPLNSITGFTDIILGRPDLPSDLRRQVQLIQSSGAALLTVVNDILDFSRIEAGEILLDPQPFSMAQLVDNTVSIVRGLATAHGLELVVTVDAQVPPWLFGDDNRLRQILLNFLNNAVKFTTRGQVSLAVGLEAGGRVRFAVIDTGIGISLKDQARLFQHFTQVDGSIQRRFGGTGLGLAISKRLVELMGGEIGVDSQEGQGSTFWFSVALPTSQAPEIILPPPGSSAIPTRAVGRILLVEDLDVNQEIAQAVLEAAGYRVDIVGDGQTAIDAVRTGRYALVLMDVQMPGMDGVTATEHIRLLPDPIGRIPIIAMTANVLPAQISRFKAAGMNAHIGKPFNKDELYATIESSLSAPALGGPTPPEVTDFDRDVLDQLAKLLGAGKIDSFLQRLEARLHDFFSTDLLAGADPEQIARQAHSLVSTAGMLGFKQLSEYCRELESACLAGDDILDGYERVRRARAVVLEKITGLRAVS